MGLLRSCYKSTMRLYPDRPDILVEGKWCFCAPGARAVPYGHPFTPSVWDANQEQLDDGLVGEVSRDGWYNGVRPEGWIGRRVCGDASAWRHGVDWDGSSPLPVGVDGLPSCCKRRRGAYGLAYSWDYDSLNV